MLYKSLCFVLLYVIIFPLFALTPIAFETPQHIPVLFYADHSIPMLTIHIGFKAGSAYDGHAYGLAALTTAMLNQGSEHYDAVTLAEQLANTGAIYTASSSRDMAAFSLTTLTAPPAYEKAISLFTHILIKPIFPQSALIQQKAQQLATLINEQESPDKQAVHLFFKTLYAHHPYAHALYGTKTSIAAITRTDLVRFYQQYFIPENAVIVIVGDISLNEATVLAGRLLAELPHGQAAPLLPFAHHPPQTQPIHLPFLASQTALCLGQLGINHHDKRYFPLLVGNYILGGDGIHSRLAKVLREKRGLTYSVQSEFLPLPGYGPFLITLSTKNKQAQLAEALVQSVTKQFIQSGPTAKELKEAKDYLIGSFPLSLASNRDIASMLLKIAFYKLPINYLERYTQRIQTVKAQDIQQAFQEILATYPLISVSVGPS